MLSDNPARSGSDFYGTRVHLRTADMIAPGY
jgi:hypothetical protein